MKLFSSKIYSDTVYKIMLVSTDSTFINAEISYPCMRTGKCMRFVEYIFFAVGSFSIPISIVPPVIKLN